MIQIYSPGNRNYERNGDAVLHPSQCDVEMNLKGEWVLTLENPADENMNLITKEAVIKCDTPIGKDQRFRIYEYEKDESGVSAKARPVFFDAAKDAFILDKRPTDKSGQEALDIITAGTGYTAETDITDFNTAYYIRKNLIEAINGEDENSFINRWGGEPVYKNEHLIINKRYGSDKGAKATFGNNLQSISETVNTDDVATRIIPMGYNGYMLDGDEPWVDSPNIGKYEIVYAKVVEYSDVKLQEDVSDESEEGFQNLDELREELKRRAKLDFENGIDLPTVTYEVEVADLEHAVGYEDIKDLVKIGLGDTVKAENKRLDIVTTNRCIGMVYDCILQKNKTVTLGETQTDYFDQMSSVQQKVNQSLTDTGVRGSMVYGLIDMVKASMKATAENAVLQKEKAILFEDKIEGSESYGTTGFMIASKRLPDDSDWDWSTFGTGAGFFADFIVAGTMLADRIKGGTLELGGEDNGDGIARVLDGNGKEIVRLDNSGVYAKGRYICEGIKEGIQVELYEGNIIFRDESGKATYIKGRETGGSTNGIMIYQEQGGTITNYFAVDYEMTRAQFEEIYLRASDVLSLSCKTLEVGTLEKAYNAKTGRMEFSDGTYAQYVNGILVGGSSMEGAF